MVKDDPSGNDFGHRESRDGTRTEGRYYVLLPDGRKQVVKLFTYLDNLSYLQFLKIIYTILYIFNCI